MLMLFKALFEVIAGFIYKMPIKIICAGAAFGW